MDKQLSPALVYDRFVMSLPFDAPEGIKGRTWRLMAAALVVLGAAGYGKLSLLDRVAPYRALLSVMATTGMLVVFATLSRIQREGIDPDVDTFHMKSKIESWDTFFVASRPMLVGIYLGASFVAARHFYALVRGGGFSWSAAGVGIGVLGGVINFLWPQVLPLID
jgi:hypothetical protein